MAKRKGIEQFVEDPKQTNRVSQAAAPLVRALANTNLDFRFYIIEDGIPNAFALPGGHVLITSGLLEMIDRPEELAGVLAHEIAHVTEKHGIRKIISDAGPYLIF